MSTKARKDLVDPTTGPAKRPATSEPLFYVVGEHKAQTAYYCGWWHSYGEPLLTHHPLLGAKAMKRAGANRIRRRLENPDIWGGAWRIELAPPPVKTTTHAQLLVALPANSRVCTYTATATDPA